MLLGLSLLTLLSLFSSSRGVFTEALITFLTNLVGWGRYIVWFFFGSLGIWVFRRYGVEDDDEKWEKPVGSLLLLAVLLIIFELLSPADDPLISNENGGGGIIGWILAQFLLEALGTAGAAVVVALMLVLAVVFISDLSFVELFSRLRDLYFRFQDWRHFRKLPINQQSQPGYNPPGAVGQLPAGSRPGILGRLFPRRREPDIVDGVRIIGDDEAKPKTSFLNRLRSGKPATGQAGDDIQIVRGPAGVDNGKPSPVSVPKRGKTRPVPAVMVEPEEIPATSGTVLSTGGHRQWHLPIIAEILDDIAETEVSEEELRSRARLIEETLASFGVEAKVREINPGPAVTQFSLQPGYLATRDAKGNRRKVRVSKIVNLSNDLALALEAAPIRIEAPIPGRPYVGIEVPNVAKSIVTLRSILESAAFYNHSGILKIGLGRDVSGNSVVIDLTQMPHLLIAGATGSGKSGCVNNIVSGLICTHTPETLKLLMIDPKMVELINYNGIPHLIAPVVTELERVPGVLSWATREMDRRYKEFSKVGARNIVGFNSRMAKAGQETLPYIVIIIDELADLMMMAPDEVERGIARIAQMARATGIHLIIATQRPSVDVVTGLIKANFPARIAFAVSSQTDSRVILDTPGAERLLGKGDMLYMAPDAAKLQRLLGVWVAEPELERLIKFWGGGLGLSRPSLGPVIDPGPLEQQSLIPGLPPSSAAKKAPPMMSCWTGRLRLSRRKARPPYRYCSAA